MTEHSGSPRRVGVVGPLILIGLGIVLLLQQNGWLHWSIWEIAFRLWPLIIIAVGVDLLIGRRSFLGSVAAVCIVILLFLGGIWLMGNGPVGRQKLETDHVQFPMEAMDLAGISILQASGAISMDALSSGSQNVLTVDIQDAWADRIRTSGVVRGGIGTYEIRKEGPEFSGTLHGDSNRWDMMISPDIPVDFDVMLGAGDIRADFGDLVVSDVELKLGAGAVLLDLPEKAGSRLSIRIGVGSVEIRLPENVGVSINCTTGVGNCSLPNGSGFWSRQYTSPGYEESAVRIILEIVVGVGEVRII